MKELVDAATWAAIKSFTDGTELEDRLNEANFATILQIVANRDKFIRDLAEAHTGASAPHAGHETPSGAQTKVNTHADQSAPHSGHETPSGAQTKVNTHADQSAPHSGHALKYGSTAQTFLVGAATSNYQAVRLDQFSMGSGYFKIPAYHSPTGTKKDFIIQWGSVASGGGSQVVPFNVVFPNAVFTVQGQRVGIAGDQNILSRTGVTLSNFTMDPVSAGTYEWFAFGY